jgi:hypothetical protein
LERRVEMAIYRCNKCDKYFDEPATRTSTYESEYGLTREFSSSTTCYINKCPNCYCEEFEEVNYETSHDFSLQELADRFGEDEVIEFLNEGE